MQKTRARGSNVYRVERLVDSRTRGNRTEYLVKWKNWSDSHNTWEPSKNILDKRLIESFLRRERRKKEQLSKEATEVVTDTSRNSDLDHDTSTETEHRANDTQTSNDLSQSVQTPESVQSPTHSDVGFSSPPVLTSPVHPTSHPDPIITPHIRNPSGSPVRSLFSSDLVSSLINQSTHATTLTTSATTSEVSDWSSDRRFRKTTLLVAAASASAANAAAALASSRNATKHSHSTVSSTQIMPEMSRISNQATTPSHSAPTNESTDSNMEERPKIRLTIPRERLLAAGLPTNPSQPSTAAKSASSNHDDPSIDSVGDDHPKFLAPVEKPRRGLPACSPHLINPTAGLRLPDVTIEHHPHGVGFDADFQSKSPKWEKQTSLTTSLTQLPKIVLFASDQHLTKKRQRQSSDSDGTLYHGVEQESKRKKHSQKKEKRKKRRDHGQLGSSHRFDSDSYESPSSYHYVNPSKIRRRSGSSTSHTSTLSSESYSPSMPSTSPSTTDDVPRLAPLRIQLPRSLATQLSAPGSLSSLTTDSQSNSNYFGRKYPNAPLSVQPNRLRDPNRVQNSTGLPVVNPNSKHLRLVQEMCVTDITVGGLTISIKECTGPDNFFGVPSSQLVKLNDTGSKLDAWSKSTEELNHPPNVIEDCPTQSQRSDPPVVDKAYADENVAPDLGQETAPRPVIQPDKTSTLHKDHEVHQLSVIYEESSGDLSAPSIVKSTDSRPASPQNLETPENGAPVLKSPMKTEDTTKNEHEVSHNSTSSTSALVLAATEAAERMASEAPSSPGLLILPRRASTPVEQAPSTPCESASQSLVEPGQSVSAPSPKRSLASSPLPSAAPSPPRKVLISKLTPSPTPNRPMATIFGQVRNRNAQPGKSSANTQEPRKSKSKLGSSHGSPSSSGSSNSPMSSVGPMRPVLLNRTAKSSCDPSSVYAFPDESPTLTLPRTNNRCSGGPQTPRGAASSSIKAKPGGSKTHLSGAIVPRNSDSDFQTCLGDPVPNFLNLQPPLVMPNSLSNANLPPPLSCPMSSMPSSSDKTLATAFCLQQLQMQFMCPNSATAAAAAAAALINVISSSSFSSNPFSNTSCATPAQLNVSAAMNSGSCMTSDQDRQLMAPTFQPSSVHLPPMYPTDPNLLNSVHPTTVSTVTPSLPFSIPLHLTDMVGNSNMSIASLSSIVGDTNDLPIDLSSKR